MKKRSRSSFRVAALLAAAALAAPLLGVTPAMAASPASVAAPTQLPRVLECEHGSRDILDDKARDRTRVSMIAGGGKTEITLRSNGDGSCWWALTDGRSEVWLEAVPLYDNMAYPGSEHITAEENTKKKMLHTAAFVARGYAVRACGLPFDGTITDSRTWSLDGEIGWKHVSVGGSYEDSDSFEGTYSEDGQRCTEYRTADEPAPTFGGQTSIPTLAGGL